MASFRTGVVVRLLSQRTGLCRVEVDLGDGPERAYALTALTGPVAVGDEVVVNTTAVELGLGTGGWHVVHWNLARREWRAPGPGHVMKLRYTSLQCDAGAAEEDGQVGVEGDGPVVPERPLAGVPVVVAGLHSQLAGVAVAFREAAPGARLVYVMTDGAALPIALSDLVADLVDRSLIAATITAANAFGGDFEAVSVPSALFLARERAGADAVVAAMGPGGVGTGSALGFSATEVAAVLDAAGALGAEPIAALRASSADPRPRHRGLSHHCATTLGRLCRSPVTVAVPEIGGPGEERLRADLERSGVTARHRLAGVPVPDVAGLFERHGLEVSSMGRPAAGDPVLFACAAAAGTLAGRLVGPEPAGGAV